jgi:hypothetical protein
MQYVVGKSSPLKHRRTYLDVESPLRVRHDAQGTAVSSLVLVTAVEEQNERNVLEAFVSPAVPQTVLFFWSLGTVWY